MLGLMEPQDSSDLAHGSTMRGSSFCTWSPLPTEVRLTAQAMFCGRDSEVATRPRGERLSVAVTKSPLVAV
jgi:hypothetical protein